MQTNVETRVEHTLTVRMTETKWREVLDDPKKFFSEMRKELEELKFAPKGTLRAIAGDQVGSKKAGKPCPNCGREFTHLAMHLRSCGVAKSGALAAASSSRSETESPMDEPIANSANGS
jgi:hypothetical protein